MDYFAKMHLINVYYRESDFAALMKNLMASPDAQGKLRAAEELTKATTADHGFLAFYEYIKSTLSDEIEVIDLFTRIVLSRPRSYPDFRVRKLFLVKVRLIFLDLLNDHEDEFL